jgi:hypothetical protein
MHNSLKIFLKTFVSYFALHVLGTLVPIIRSFPLFLHSTASGYRVPLCWLRIPAMFSLYCRYKTVPRTGSNADNRRLYAQ